ncbi:MAG: 4-hydroxy-3-methylbut-2-enyl diphosphate reductase [Spirochaetaceae bacterium]|jgi:4-hydroxy-3-methylbut-2-enyl diphosphate reductase|nr:4-hydroxy-3-methylbut-2-enyl diphosphate reductase [Spirochaetaceae bacterium]
MKVLRSELSGYCMGVRRALDLSFEAAKTGRPLWTFGELIHNNSVLQDLAKIGVHIIRDIENCPDIKDSVVVLCAHGVPPATEAFLRARAAEIIDASCPMVKKSQLKAAELARTNRVVFLAGEKNHSEVVGIKGYNEAIIIVSSVDEAQAQAEALYQKSPEAETALLAQTTISRIEYTDIARSIKKYFPHLSLIDTICGATASRQEALRALCKKVDALIIAGGNASSNTRRLLAIAENEHKAAWLVENADELPDDIFLFDTVGVAAGASTPDKIIDDIVFTLQAPHLP